MRGRRNDDALGVPWTRHARQQGHGGRTRSGIPHDAGPRRPSGTTGSRFAQWSSTGPCRWIACSLHKTESRADRHSHSVSHWEINQAPSIPQWTGPELRAASGNRTPDLLITRALMTDSHSRYQQSDPTTMELGALSPIRSATVGERLGELIIHYG